jgi:hypothetical protein
MNVQANRLQIIVAEGTSAVVDDVNRLLCQQEPGIRVVAIEYNYQAPEYYQGVPVAEGRHGILLALTHGEQDYF